MHHLTDTTTPLPALDVSVGTSRATSENNTLTVTTGRFGRTWILTRQGLRTKLLNSIHGHLPTVPGQESEGADWEAKGWIDASTPGELVSLTAGESTDDGFTNRHLKVVAEFHYPTAGTSLRYVVWVFPGADGLRTQLWLRSTSNGTDPALAPAPPEFQLVEGKPEHGSLVHESELVLRVGPIDPAKTYELAVLGAKEDEPPPSVTLSSIDNETRIPLAPANDALSPALGEIPPAVRPDNFTTVRIRSRAGRPARISYARVLENGFPLAEITSESPAATGRKPTKENTHTKPSHRTDWIPIAPAQLHAIGYFSDTQNRHTPETRLLREESVKPGLVDWANILCSESSAPGMSHLALVKESHKCVNQTGVDTGAFIANEKGIAMTGLGLSRSDLSSSEWRWAWANWVIAYPAASVSATLDDQRELALKEFLRTRYPIQAGLDLIIRVCTWGSGRNGEESSARASEQEVLAEIDSAADLGADALRIDDGWQTGRMEPPQPADRRWIVRPDWYPQGWKRVVAHAAKKGIRLDIWHACSAPLDALKKNYDEAGFRSWKMDFANLSTHQSLREMLAKGRDFVAYTGHTTRMIWDVTEIEPRYGYFWASECGNLWLLNRKPVMPEVVVAKPWLMLRESREMSRYLNIKKLELPIQNFALVNPGASDAHLHSTTYATALGLAGIPVLFQTTRLLTPGQRAGTKKVLEEYKKHRSAMFAAHVFPVGDEPDNKSWSGFQWFDPARPGEGYLLVFRERLNAESEHWMPLRFLKPHTPLKIENLLTGKCTEITLDSARAAKLVIPEPGDVLFARYTT